MLVTEETKYFHRTLTASRNVAGLMIYVENIPIVEIAGYDNPCTIIERIDRIYGRNQMGERSGRWETEPATSPLWSKTASQVPMPPFTVRI